MPRSFHYHVGGFVVIVLLLRAVYNVLGIVGAAHAGVGIGHHMPAE